LLYILIRILRAAILRRNLALPAMIGCFVFLTSWPFMWLFEPAGAALVRPENYWWWFLVTCATVGYGDYVPTTFGGHVVGLYVIVGGVATLTTLFAQLSLVFDHVRRRRMNGSMSVRHTGHIVLLGYTHGRSERLIAELVADPERPVVLGATAEVSTHPMPEEPIDFVRGDYTDLAVLRRAGVDRAYGVLVDVRDDNEALAVSVAVAHLAPGALVVVALRDLTRATHVRYINPDARCVQWHNPRMLTEELQSPGIAEVYAELMTHGGGNTYSVTVPAGTPTVAFGEWQTCMGRRHAATIIAVRTPDALLVAPAWDAPVPAASVLYYVGRYRLTSADVLGAREAVAV
jgi:voltage-gated potassium channel